MVIQTNYGHPRPGCTLKGTFGIWGNLGWFGDRAVQSRVWGIKESRYKTRCSNMAIHFTGCHWKNAVLQNSQQWVGSGSKIQILAICELIEYDSLSPSNGAGCVDRAFIRLTHQQVPWSSPMTSNQSSPCANLPGPRQNILSNPYTRIFLRIPFEFLLLSLIACLDFTWVSLI
jgi:hypothetical protein